MKHDERKCPACAEPVKIEALVCKHCGKQFDPADVARAKKQQRNSMLGGFAVLVIILLAIGTCSSSDDADPKAVAEKAEDKRMGRQCLSPWDGANRSFVDAVKSQLRDPDSFEHESTRLAPVENGKHAAVMQYRAKNGFGGYNRAIAVGDINAADCSATVDTIDSKVE
jgi:predicted nucleic acid-binding Zn ribbon protein